MPRAKRPSRPKPKIPVVLTESERINEFGEHEPWMFERAPKLSKAQQAEAKHHEAAQTKTQAKAEDARSGKQRWTTVCWNEDCMRPKHPDREFCSLCEGDHRFWEGWRD